MQQEPKCQVKVMRLALTKPSSKIGSSSSRGALLSLPKVFESIHAGQTLRCLARVLFAPRNSRVTAHLQYLDLKSSPITEVGVSTGEGMIDLVIRGLLHHAGTHELVIACVCKEFGEVLRKSFKIEVSPSLLVVPSLSLTTTTLPLWAQFTVQNVSKEAIFCIQRVALVLFTTSVDSEEVIEAESSSLEKGNLLSVFVRPLDAHSFIFRMPPTSRAARGNLVVEFTCGLGESAILKIAVENLPLVDARTTTATTTIVAQVGVPQRDRLPPLQQHKDVLLYHGPMQGKGEVIPIAPGLFTEESLLVAMDAENFSQWL